MPTHHHIVDAELQRGGILRDEERPFEEHLVLAPLFGDANDKIAADPKADVVVGKRVPVVGIVDVGTA